MILRSFSRVNSLNGHVGATSNRYQSKQFTAEAELVLWILLPLAICCEATKFSQFLRFMVALIYLSQSSGILSSDSDGGRWLRTRDINVTQEQLERCIASFKSETDQIPSMFSSIEVSGKPLYLNTHVQGSRFLVSLAKIRCVLYWTTSLWRRWSWDGSALF